MLNPSFWISGKFNDVFVSGVCGIVSSFSEPTIPFRVVSESVSLRCLVIASNCLSFPESFSNEVVRLAVSL